MHMLDTLALVAAVAVVTAGCERPHTARPEVPPPTVAVTDVEQKTMPIIMQLNGSVTSVKTVNVIPRVSGYITQRPFVEGTFVKEGSLLYQIDPRPFQARLDALRGSLSGDQANVTYLTKEVDEVRKAAAQGAASPNEVRKWENELATAKGALESTQGQISDAQLDIEFTKITAPFAGRIQATNLDVGNVVTAQKSVLTTLVQLDPIYVTFNVSRRQAFEIQQLQAQGLAKRPAVGNFRVRVMLPDGREFPHEGTVDFISGEIDPSTDTLAARAVFDNPFKDVHDALLIPGQYVPVRLIVGERPDCLVIPEKAVVHSQLGARVYVVGGDDKVEGRTLELGPLVNGERIVLGGLNRGDRVVVDGTQKVRPNITVKVAEPAKDRPA